ncbi:hypothetical protein IID23_02215 [Patescibacteria group bacterium]|nr:hypothetical protein [Patescibacteria group bacterium]
MDSEALEMLRNEISRRDNWNDQIKQSELYAAVEREEMNLFVILNLKLQKDGNQWCVLLGDDIQSGICGFGETPKKAIWDFNKSFETKLTVPPKLEL